MKIRKKLDEYGMVISDELDFKFYGGGGKGGGGKTEKIYMPAPAALAPVATPVVTPAPVAAQTYSGTPVPAAVNGAVWKILVNEGDTVAKDQQIMILEAMKMEIDVIAPVSGVISKILVNQTQTVEEGETLAIIG